MGGSCLDPSSGTVWPHGLHRLLLTLVGTQFPQLSENNIAWFKAGCRSELVDVLMPRAYALLLPSLRPSPILLPPPASPGPAARVSS